MIRTEGHQDVTRLELSSWAGRRLGYTVSVYQVGDLVIDTGFPRVARQLAAWFDTARPPARLSRTGTRIIPEARLSWRRAVLRWRCIRRRNVDYAIRASPRASAATIAVVERRGPGHRSGPRHLRRHPQIHDLHRRHRTRADPLGEPQQLEPVGRVRAIVSSDGVALPKTSDAPSSLARTVATSRVR